MRYRREDGGERAAPLRRRRCRRAATPSPRAAALAPRTPPPPDFASETRDASRLVSFGEGGGPALFRAVEWEADPAHV